MDCKSIGAFTSGIGMWGNGQHSEAMVGLADEEVELFDAIGAMFLVDGHLQLNLVVAVGV
jgi:hypothetical protein